MSDADVKRRLVEFLDEHVFRPILQAKPEDFPEDKRAMLEDVQQTARNEQDRYGRYESAEQVYEAYHGDLNAINAREVYRKLRELGLPTLADVRIDFEQMAHDLGIGAGSIPV